MPLKGHTCANYAGDCCSIVSFTGPSDQLSIPDVMFFSVNEIKALGYKEIR